MKESAKGAIAASAAALLLLGGATSLAYWTATGTVDGGTITAGTLTPTADTCADDWEYAEGSASEGTAVDLWVPGDNRIEQFFVKNASNDAASLQVQLRSGKTDELIDADNAESDGGESETSSLSSTGGNTSMTLILSIIAIIISVVSLGLEILLRRKANKGITDENS